MQEELMDCYNNRKLINKDFIEYFIFHYVDILGLNQVVKDICFSRSPDTLVSYSPRHLSIIISRNNTFNRMLISKGKRVEELTDIELLIMCIRFLEMLFHELTHAKQEIIIRSLQETNPLIKQILLEDAHIFRWQNHLYDRHYDDFITEYNAEIMSKVMTSYFFNDYPLLQEVSNININEEIYKMVKKYYLRNEKNSYPIIRFKQITSKIFCEDDIINMEGFNNLTEFEKIKYGIPLDDITMDKLEEMPKVKIKNFGEYFNKR